MICIILSLTCHGIDANWDSKNFVLAIEEFPGSHTGSAIATKIKQLLDKWGLPDQKIAALVTDSGSNMVKV